VNGERGTGNGNGNGNGERPLGAELVLDTRISNSNSRRQALAWASARPHLSLCLARGSCGKPGGNPADSILLEAARIRSFYSVATGLTKCSAQHRRRLHLREFPYVHQASGHRLWIGRGNGRAVTISGRCRSSEGGTDRGGTGPNKANATASFRHAQTTPEFPPLIASLHDSPFTVHRSPFTAFTVHRSPPSPFTLHRLHRLHRSPPSLPSAQHCSGEQSHQPK